MSDGELWTRRDAYARDGAWAPPYVADELRDAHLAEGAYRADAVRAWYRADAAASRAERAQARQEAEEYRALAQEVGAYREALAEVAEARRRWHAATELDRRRAVAADAELRRRQPDAELPPLHPDEGPSRPELDAESAAQAEAGSGNQAEADSGRGSGEPGLNRRDVRAALVAARWAERILAERGQQAELESEDVTRRQEAEALREAEARRSAVRREPAPSRRMVSVEREAPELEAGL